MSHAFDVFLYDMINNFTIESIPLKHLRVQQSGPISLAIEYGFKSLVVEEVFSRWPTYMVAKAGANLVPMAMPHN